MAGAAADWDCALRAPTTSQVTTTANAATSTHTMTGGALRRSAPITIALARLAAPMTIAMHPTPFWTTAYTALRAARAASGLPSGGATARRRDTASIIAASRAIKRICHPEGSSTARRLRAPHPSGGPLTLQCRG